jgi:hypothetical protein
LILVVGDGGHFAGLFSKPAAMRNLPGPVNRGLPARSIIPQPDQPGTAEAL